MYMYSPFNGCEKQSSIRFYILLKGKSVRNRKIVDIHYDTVRFHRKYIIHYKYLL